jgi:hypothetical protein
MNAPIAVPVSPQPAVLEAFVEVLLRAMPEGLAGSDSTEASSMKAVVHS